MPLSGIASSLDGLLNINKEVNILNIYEAFSSS